MGTDPRVAIRTALVVMAAVLILLRVFGFAAGTKALIAGIVAIVVVTTALSVAVDPTAWLECWAVIHHDRIEPIWAMALKNIARTADLGIRIQRLLECPPGCLRISRYCTGKCPTPTMVSLISRCS